MSESVPCKHRAKLIVPGSEALLLAFDVFDDPTHQSRQPAGYQHNPQRENRRLWDHQADAQSGWHQAS